MVEIDEKFIVDATEIAGNKLFEEGKISNWDSYYLRKDGRIVPVESNIAYLYNDERETIGAIGVSRDITERRQAENALRVAYQELEEKIKERTAKLETANQQLSREITNHLQTEKTLRKSEGKYQSLIEHANDTIISINREGIIIGFNKKAEEMFGYSREEILGKPATSLAPPPQIEKQRKMLKKFKKGELADIDKILTEGKGLKKNGQVFSSEFSYYVLELHGEYIATAIIRDITERKKAGKKVLEYQKRLKSLTSQMTLNEEKERKRLSDYLHDQIGQELFAAKIKLELLKDSLSSTGLSHFS
jgi:PAS domain S-box-containing protein